MISRTIESPQNPTIKKLTRLKERRQRDLTQRYLIEGQREVSRAMQAGVELETLFICPGLWQAGGEQLELHALRYTEGAWVLLGTSFNVTELSEAAFRKLSYREHPDGFLALAPIIPRTLTDVVLPTSPLLLVLDSLEKPGNVGALLRTADAAGVHAVVITGQGTDLYNPNVIRASMGSLFHMSVVHAEAADLRAFLLGRQIPIIATTPHSPASYWDMDYRAGAAVVLGNEAQGLDRAWLAEASQRAHIPMQGMADSLNVSTAGALVLYEALRQRSLL